MQKKGGVKFGEAHSLRGLRRSEVDKRAFMIRNEEVMIEK